MTRRVPDEVSTRWEQLTTADSPIDALVSSHALLGGIGRWQSNMVGEAVAEGASWEDVGAALGTTRQAAWARFRVAIESDGGRAEVEDRDEVKRRWKQLWDSGQAQLRQMEDAWRGEERRLRDELKAARDRLRDERHRHSRQRREARHRLREEVLAARRTVS